MQKIISVNEERQHACITVPNSNGEYIGKKIDLRPQVIEAFPTNGRRAV